MSGNTNPTPSQVLAALRNGGVDVKTYKGWDTVGRPWKGPDGSPGLMGVVCHHTANPHADQGVIQSGMLSWATTAYDLPVCNLLVGRDQTYLLAAGSVYHCGDGGPIPELGIPGRGFQGQTRLFGIEIDDPGVKASTLTPYQIENVGRVLAALATLCGWNVDKSVITHKCYTDLCHTEAKQAGACLGRKNDTIDGPWATFKWDGMNDPQPYNAPWWREQARKWMVPAATWDGTVPSMAAVQKADHENLRNKAAWRAACRLFDLGFKNSRPAPAGTQKYPAASVMAFQKAQGLDPSGEFTADTQKRLFGKVKP